MRKQNKDSLDVAKIISEFNEEENRVSSHREGTFKIDAPFEEALDTIPKAKPESTNKKLKG